MIPRVYSPPRMIRSYDPEYTPSRPIWEVKQDSARPVLRTEMTREALVTNLLPPFYAVRMYGRECARNRPEKRANGAVSALRVGRGGGRPRRPAGAGSNLPGVPHVTYIWIVL